VPDGSVGKPKTSRRRRPSSGHTGHR